MSVDAIIGRLAAGTLTDSDLAAVRTWPPLRGVVLTKLVCSARTCLDTRALNVLSMVNADADPVEGRVDGAAMAELARKVRAPCLFFHPTR
jgi:hypothetical protein